MLKVKKKKIKKQENIHKNMDIVKIDSIQPWKKNPRKIEKQKNIHKNLAIVDIDSIQPWEKNPRKNKKAIARLAALISQYGQRSPVVIWEKNNKIYKGNTTWFAMKILGFIQIAVSKQNFKDEKEAISYAISDNKASEWSEWDKNVLIELFSSDEFKGVDKREIENITGFKDVELNNIFTHADKNNIQETIPDRAYFIVVEFNNKTQLQTFKRRAKIGGGRIIHYENLMKMIKFKQ